MAAAGSRRRPPAAGRQFGQIVIGAALGLYFTPAVGREVLSYAPSIVLAALAAVLTGYLSGLILAALARTDGASAFFASLPGGAAEMSVLAERHGAAVE
ncbi:MAG: AbrB family transcriptional regulator [Rhodocyclaceae bacterium]|nr:AbrB family transcriptional regulator [Rhodocyclaceae bacterium]